MQQRNATQHNTLEPASKEDADKDKDPRTWGLLARLPGQPQNFFTWHALCVCVCVCVCLSVCLIDLSAALTLQSRLAPELAAAMEGLFLEHINQLGVGVYSLALVSESRRQRGGASRKSAWRWVADAPRCLSCLICCLFSACWESNVSKQPKANDKAKSAKSAGKQPDTAYGSITEVRSNIQKLLHTQALLVARSKQSACMYAYI